MSAMAILRQSVGFRMGGTMKRARGSGKKANTATRDGPLMFTYTEKCGICGREAQYEFGRDIIVCASCGANKVSNGWQPREAKLPPHCDTPNGEQGQ